MCVLGQTFYPPKCGKCTAAASAGHSWALFNNISGESKSWEHSYVTLILNCKKKSKIMLDLKIWQTLHQDLALFMSWPRFLRAGYRLSLQVAGLGAQRISGPLSQSPSVKWFLTRLRKHQRAQSKALLKNSIHVLLTIHSSRYHTQLTDEEYLCLQVFL